MNVVTISVRVTLGSRVQLSFLVYVYICYGKKTGKQKVEFIYFSLSYMYKNITPVELCANGIKKLACVTSGMCMFEVFSY